MSSCIGLKHREALSEIIIRKPGEVLHAAARISMHTDYDFLAAKIVINRREIHAVKLKIVKRLNIHVLMLPAKHELLSFGKHVFVLRPVCSRHLNSFFHFGILPDHRTSVQIDS